MNFYRTTNTLTIQGTKDSVFKKKIIDLIKDSEPDGDNLIQRDSYPDREEHDGNDSVEIGEEDEGNDCVEIGEGPATEDDQEHTDSDIEYSTPNDPVNSGEYITRGEFEATLKGIKLQIHALKQPGNEDLAIENKYLKDQISSLLEENQKLRREKEQLCQAFDIIVSSKSNTKNLEENVDQILNINNKESNQNITSNLHKMEKAQNKRPKKDSTHENNGNPSVMTKQKDKKIHGMSHVNKVRPSTPNVVIIGDSMIRNIDGAKLSRHKKVKVVSHPGATVDDIHDYIKPVLRRKPDHIIIHVGTNNLNTDKPKEVKKKIMKIIEESQQANPDVSLTISSIVKRTDDTNLMNKSLQDFPAGESKSGEGKIIDSKTLGRGLVMAILNINSILAHIDELRATLISSKIDILAINETKLDSSVSNSEINIPGFEIARKDRAVNGRSGGGVCLYVRSNINFSLVSDFSDERLELITIEISMPCSKPYLVSTWYRPPNTTAELFLAFEEILDKIDQTNLEYYLLGDINCDMLSTNSSLYKHLSDTLDIYGLEQLIKEPTRITQNSQTLIDLCITNTPDKIVQSGVIHTSISDHSLAFMCRKTNHNKENSRIIETRNFKKFDEKLFLKDISQMPWIEIESSSNPNQMWKQWREMFMFCVDKHAPIKHKRVGKQKPSWFTNDLIAKIRNRDYLKKKAVSSKDSHLWAQYKQARNNTNNAIKRTKKEYFANNLEKYKNDQRKTWKLLNELTSKKPNNHSTVAQLKYDDKQITSSIEIANTFNTFFTKIGETLASSIHYGSNNPESYLESSNTTFTIETPSIETVCKILEGLNERKAIGLDKIPSRLLKLSATIVAPSLTSIYSKSIETGIFPQEWKLAKVTPIFKKGDKTDPGNYRPISVIPVVSKVFEKIIYDQLFAYFNENDLLVQSQSGFRNLHSTVTALIEATSSWSLNIDRGMFNGIVFIDLQKAFDTIDHSILLTKLKSYGIDDNSITWFNSYLSNRLQQCSANGSLSTPCEVNLGIPQGSNLGPLLFLIYINDLPKCLTKATPRMFADDTSISVASHTITNIESDLNTDLNHLNRWLIANRLSLNVAKTELMIMGSRQKFTAHGYPDLDVKINNVKINQVDQTKTLGVIVDKNLNWSAHTKQLTKKVASAIGALKRSRQYLSTKSALQIYDAIILPHFDYCSQVWDGLYDNLSNQIQKLHNRAARAITKSNYDIRSHDIRSDLNWDTLEIRRKKQKLILMFKIMNGLAPKYLRDLFEMQNAQYTLRNNKECLHLPKPNTEYMKRSFLYSAPKLWNELPLHARQCKNLSTFKNTINNLHTFDSHGKHGKQ